MVLRAVMTLVDERNAEGDKFIELAVEGSSHAGVKSKEILQHLGTMGQRLLHVAGLAAKSAIIDLAYFLRRGFRANQTNACHRVLRERDLTFLHFPSSQNTRFRA